MEFKVFKNENSKILKEYWLTQSEWDALDKTTVQEGDIYHIVGTIDKGDLSADINAALDRATNSIQTPTNQSTGADGDVLIKKGEASEWKSLSTPNVVQATGQSATDVMSQKAVTDELQNITTAVDAKSTFSVEVWE